MMEVRHIPEPELEFGAGKHVDIRYGLMAYGPLDFDQPTAPKHIRVGIVGVPETVETFSNWLEKCTRGIPAKESKLTNLFPPFPGYHEEVTYRSKLVLDKSLVSEIRPVTFEKLTKNDNFNAMIEESAALVLDAITHLAETQTPNVIVCAMPDHLYERIDQQRAAFVPSSRAVVYDFHDMLKAKALGLRIPLQLIWPHTYDPSKRRKQRNNKKTRQLQDEATVAWNLHSGFYYKSGGIPYRMIRDASDLDTCYIGISFYETLDKDVLMTSLAQVFNQRGEGVIVRGGAAVRDEKDDRQIHLTEDDAYRLLYDALETYRREHRNLPARAVIHKSSRFNEAELDGLNRALGDQKVDTADFVSLRFGTSRLFRKGEFPPLRGTFLSKDKKHHTLYTKGSVEFYQSYPGMYVPRALDLYCDQTDQTPYTLGKEILMLTKMNYNVTQFDGSEPMTLRVAKKVGQIVRYVDANEVLVPHYKMYM